MQVTDERNLETIPVGPLGIIPLESCKELGDKVNSYLVAWRNEREHEHKSNIAFKGYQRDSYIIGTATPRFGSGEAKGRHRGIRPRLTISIIMVDVCNYSHDVFSVRICQPHVSGRPLPGFKTYHCCC